MTVLRVFMNPVDLSIPGGTFSTNTTYYDPTRSAGAFRMGPAQTASVDFPPAPSGTVTWFHFVYGTETTDANYDASSTIFIRDAGGNDVARMDTTNGSPNFLVVGDSVVATATQIISAATMYSIDIMVDVTPTLITVSGYVNTVLIGTVTSANTVGSRGLPTKLGMANFDNQHASNFAEGVISTEDTRGYRVRELRPTSFGVDQAWAGSVADVVDNDLSTGISTPTTGARTSFGVSNLENISAGDIVNRIVAQSYAQRGASGLTRFNHYFRYADTTRQDGPDITVATTGAWYLTEFLTNPKTAAPWVPADLAGIQLGLRAQT